MGNISFHISRQPKQRSLCRQPARPGDSGGPARLFEEVGRLHVDAHGCEDNGELLVFAVAAVHANEVLLCRMAALAFVMDQSRLRVSVGGQGMCGD